jgi:hypothetical protein
MFCAEVEIGDPDGAVMHAWNSMDRGHYCRKDG